MVLKIDLIWPRHILNKFLYCSSRNVCPCDWYFNLTAWLLGVNLQCVRRSSTQFGGIQPGLVTDKEVEYEIVATFVDETKINCKKIFSKGLKLLPAAEAHNVFFSHETISSPVFCFFFSFSFFVLFSVHFPSLALICTKHIWSCSEIPKKKLQWGSDVRTHTHLYIITPWLKSVASIICHACTQTYMLVSSGCDRQKGPSATGLSIKCAFQCAILWSNSHAHTPTLTAAPDPDVCCPRHCVCVGVCSIFHLDPFSSFQQPTFLW